MKKLFIIVFVAIMAGACSRQEAKKSTASPSATAVAATGPFTPAELKAFTSLDPVDTHSHIFVTNKNFIAMIEKLNLHTLDIAVDDDTDPYLGNLPRQISDGLHYVAASDGHSVFCTTFDPWDLHIPRFPLKPLSINWPPWRKKIPWNTGAPYSRISHVISAY